MLSNLSAPVPCVLSNFRCKLVKSNSGLKIIITLKVFNILTSSHGIRSQECCLHSVLFTRRYVTFVLVIITFAFTLYSVVVLEKNRSRTTIFKSILEQLRKYSIVQPSEWKLDNILPYTIKKKLARLDKYFVRYFDFCVTGLIAFRPIFKR